MIALGLLLVSGAPAQPARWSAEAWIDDLDYLRLQIATRHGNPFHTADGQALAEGFQKLRESIPLRSDFEIAFGMQRLLAALGDGHSWLGYAGQPFTPHFLFDAWEFSDGLYVTRAGPGYGKAAGARIIAIDGTPIEAVRERLALYISRDNDMDLLRQIPRIIRLAPALKAAGIAAKPDRAAFLLDTGTGEPFEMTFSAVPPQRFRTWYKKAEVPNSTPLYRRKIDVNYWYDALPGEQAVYFQFNRFVEMPGAPFEDFVTELFAFIDTRPEACLIIDLRHNDGGWMNMIDLLLDPVKKRPRLGRKDNLYVITGRETFSSALMLCVRLERQTGVLFAGEPGRGKPNSYSEFGPFELPNTGLRGSLSTHYHQEGEPLDPRDRVDVDLPASLSYKDFRDGRDPALEAVLAHWRGVRKSPPTDMPR